MKITAQEEYGLRCLLQVAREPLGFLTIQEIAARESLTTAYAAKLMRLLRKAGLVKSIRGQKGGYRLARAPEDIDVDTVLAALGGRLYEATFCADHAGIGEANGHAACIHSVDCSIRSLLVGLDRMIQGFLGRTRLSDLLCSERAMKAFVGAGAPIAIGRIRPEVTQGK